jgi:Tfp pilus assembly protein PilN
MILAETSTGTVAAIAGVGSAVVASLGSLLVALVNTRKTSDVQTKVNGQLSALLEKLDAEQEAKTKLEVELAILRDREKREH